MRWFFMVFRNFRGYTPRAYPHPNHVKHKCWRWAARWDSTWFNDRAWGHMIDKDGDLPLPALFFASGTEKKWESRWGSMVLPSFKIWTTPLSSWSTWCHPEQETRVFCWVFDMNRHKRTGMDWLQRPVSIWTILHPPSLMLKAVESSNTVYDDYSRYLQGQTVAKVGALNF